MTQLHLKPRPDRPAAMDAFLAQCGWADGVRTPLAADASFRRYVRITRGVETAMLMDAPPPWEQVEPFVRVNEHLRRYRMSVPRIVAADVEAGFLLLEDFGDHSFTRMLKTYPEREEALYALATDALVEIYRESRSDTAEDVAQLPLYDREVYLREVALFAEWFLPQLVGIARAEELRQEWLQLWVAVLDQTHLQQQCLVHRDYHADNLFFLADREGYRAVGMLDFQDALWGDAAYDLASLLEDARRDVAPETVARCLKQFVASTGVDAAVFATHYATLAAQRNAKIIGIFVRLAVRDGKVHYLNYLPRVWRHFLNDLRHPLLAPIAAFVTKHVPTDWHGVFAVDMSIGGIAG